MTTPTVLILATVLLTLLPTPQATLFSFAPTETPNQPCILVDVNSTISVKAYDPDSRLLATEKLTSGDLNISVNGSCGKDFSQLKLVFPNGLNWWFLFSKVKDSDDVSLDQLVQFVPHDVFEDITDVVDPVSFNDPGTTKVGTVDSSYQCLSESKVTYQPMTVPSGNITYDVTVTVQGIHTQAFQVEDGKFSPAKECDQDMTTTDEPTTTTEDVTTSVEPTMTTEDVTTSVEPTTEAPTNTTITVPNNTTTPSENTTVTSTTTEPSRSTTLPPVAPVNNYTVSDSNETCIALVASIIVEIQYDAKTDNVNETEKRTSEIGVPSKFKVSGSCGDEKTGDEFLSILFFDDWVLGFTFSIVNPNEVSSEALSQGEVSYKISNVTLHYTIDSLHFPNSTQPEGTSVFVIPDSKYPEFPSKSSDDAGYYKCDSTVTMTLTEEVKVKTEDLKFKAFSQDEGSDFTGDADVCSSDDDDSDNLVPILVAVVLGALVLIIIIAYLISRWKKNKKVNEYQEI